jgi:aryl-alcohol dehydrogenase-like predicted oxidoreductase
VLPQSYVPTKDTRVTFRDKHGDVHVPPICWGTWSWGDKATWHWLDDEYPVLQQARKICVDEGLTYVDNAQAYGSTENEKIHGSLVKGLPRSSYFI